MKGKINCHCVLWFSKGPKKGVCTIVYIHLGKLPGVILVKCWLSELFLISLSDPYIFVKRGL